MEGLTFSTFALGGDGSISFAGADVGLCTTCGVRILTTPAPRIAIFRCWVHSVRALSECEFRVGAEDIDLLPHSRNFSSDGIQHFISGVVKMDGSRCGSCQRSRNWSETGTDTGVSITICGGAAAAVRFNLPINGWRAARKITILAQMMRPT